MRPRCAVYVDAGYALAAAAARVTGTSLRDAVEIDYERMIDAFVEHAERESGLELLRVHWYDAARDGVPDATQQQIGLLGRVKLRLGRIGYDGEQKGVDLRIGLDLVAAAGHAAVEVVYLVSGDGDLAEAVEEAQPHGMRVVLLAIPTKTGEPRGISRHLQTAADGLDLIDAEALDSAITRRLAIVANGDSPKPAATGSGPRPNPAMLANKEPRTPTATVIAHPARVESAPADVEPAPANAELVYSSNTGRGSAPAPGHEHDASVEEAADQVVHNVLRTWLGGDIVRQRAECAASKPSIPRQVDSALLRDLSDALGVYDLSDPVRHLLRARFWNAIDSRPGG